MSRRIYIETYGCQMNVADSELMLGQLRAAGYERVERPAEADAILVNTCAIREHAEQRIYGRLGELSRYKVRRPGVVLGVAMGIGLFAPPPYLESFADRHPQFTGALLRLDDAIGGWPGVRSCGDHFLIVLRKS